MPKPIVILNGRGGVGKDTFANLCNKYCNVYHTSSVATIKEIAKDIGWDGIKDEKGRRLLSDLKDALTRYNDFPMRWLRDDVYKFHNYNNPYDIMFIDIREPDEIEKAKEEFNATTLLIVNKNVPLIESNHADMEAENYGYDFIINNNETLDKLEESAKLFIEYMLGGK